MDRPHYSRAPIVEATISLGITPPSGLLTEHLTKIRDLVRDQYPSTGEEHLYTGEVSISEPGEPPEHDDVHEHLGYVFHSEDGQRSFRANLEGFDFSVKKPYDRWEVFRDEARHLWTMFKDVSEVKEVNRVAVRYINRIDIPVSPSVDLEKYLSIYPELPDTWPSGTSIHNFFMQVQSWQEDLGCNLIVNQAPARPPETEMTSIRLDFDLFRESFENPWRVDEEEEIWDYLEKLHERNNEIFQASITDATKDLIT
jgi:uncharacterized protein (TIGR04255 family)